MARNRITRPQNNGANRNRSMRNNSRVQQNRGTFQGGLSRNQGVAPQGPGQGPGQGGQPPMTCPPGLEPGVDDAGQKTCKPAQANIAGNVPVNNANRAIAPKPGIKPKGY
jgi:hypothetical protein